MSLANITFHMPVHRETAIKLQTEPREAEAAYDRYIGEYMAFLSAEAAKADLVVNADQQDFGVLFSIDASSHDTKQQAHAWLESQPDIWNWIP